MADATTYPEIRTGSWWRGAALLAGIVLSVAVFQWAHASLPNVAQYRLQNMQMASLPAPDYALASEAKFNAHAPPFQHNGRFGISRIIIQVNDPKTANLALLIGRARDNYEIYVNGQLAEQAIGVLSSAPTLHGFHPRLVRLLPAFLVPGSNAIDVLVARNATNAVLRDVYVGPVGELEPHYRLYKLLTHDNAEIVALLAGIVLVFALALTSVIDNRALMTAICLTLLLFVLRELHALWVNYPWPQMWRDVYLNAIAACLWCACAAFINELTGGPEWLRRWFLSIGFAVAFIDRAAYSLYDCPIAYGIGSNLQAACGAGALVFMTWRVIRHYRHAPDAAAIEIFLATTGLCMALATLASQSMAFVPKGMPNVALDEGFSQFGAMAIILFIAANLARHGITIYQMAALNNETLTRKVQEKEQALAAQHEALRATEHENTLAAERGRIMSDVHDGIGSQLLGLLIQAKSAQASPERLVDGLQAALDDLYLVVDSLDTVEGSLETALGTFRTRIEPKCAAAGVTLTWDMQGHDTARITSPTVVLQICRILQEAVSNAIRHGRATALALSLSSDAGNTVLTLKDNGKGFDPANVTGKGRGLANMRKRALSIGATFEMSGSAAGTTIRLTLPV
jgi:signal transduction histidine kinase